MVTPKYFMVKNRPFQSSRHVNGSGPAIQLLVSIFLFKMMIKTGRSYSFQTTMTQKSINLSGLTHVDDTDLMVSGKKTG